MLEHSALVTTNLHVACYTVADAAARATLAAGLASADRGTLVHQLDTGALYVCDAATSLIRISHNLSDEGYSVDASGTITLKLGDAAGAQSVSITDSGDTEVFAVNSDGDIDALTDVNALGNVTVDVTLDDGAGDSPSLKLVGGSNDDTVELFLDDDATGGDSDLAIKLCDNAGDSKLSIQDSGDTEVAYIDSDGGLSVTSATIGDGTNEAVFAADGELTLSGTARVYKNAWLNLGAVKTPGSKAATYVDHGIAGAYEFSDATDDTVVSVIRLPQDMDKTAAPEFKIGWTSATADPGDDSKQAVWQLEYLYVTPGENTTASAQGTVPSTDSMSTTANGLTISTFAMDAPASTDQLLMIRIKRLGADGDDDLGDTALLLGCGLKYVADKIGIALT